MQPRFLGEGNPNNQNIDYWTKRMNYWRDAANKATGHRKETYLADALGYEMLINGKARYIDSERIEYEN